MTTVDIDLGSYQLGWSDEEDYVFKPEKGLDENLIRQMSEMKDEPKWMLDFRLKSYKRFLAKPPLLGVVVESLTQSTTTTSTTTSSRPKVR